MSKDSHNELQPSPSQRWPALVTSIVVAAALSFACCVFAMRSAVGVVAMPGSVLGVSHANFQLVLFAATLIGSVSVTFSGVFFLLIRPSWRWTAIIPAVILPLVGVFGFGLFLVAGLG